MNKEDCKGCRSYFEGIPRTCSCRFKIVIYEDTVCPCAKCIIKGMCYTACEDFNNAYGLVPKNREESL